ncbi:CD177 antigen [Macrotis lagotis]|uniref:CD177 antigen n=1 Tax=Macrotis lagotis TaxID=92651 RepID=UPI003D680C98
MGPLMLFWLLGAVLVLPWTKGLVCNMGFLIYPDDRSAFPITWTVSLNETCQPGEGCQDTLIILESGSREMAVLSKGCTRAPAQEEKDIQHRGPPGITIASFTKVCHSDLCNDLRTSFPLWSLESQDAPAPGGLQCPVCVSLNSCPSDAPLITCPLGTAHCYNGMVQLSGGGLSHHLRVQGCVPYGGCQLLNGTKEIGPISLTESCENDRDQSTRTLTCYKGVRTFLGEKIGEQPQDLTTEHTITCEIGELCQETLLFTKSGTTGFIMSSKGCIGSGRTSSGPTRVGYPGVTIVSYTRVCSFSLCNDVKSTASILKLSGPVAPSLGDLQCPMCMALGSYCSRAYLSSCPVGTSRCYNGRFRLNGGGFSGDLAIQGCAPKVGRGCDLLENTRIFGPIAVTEICQDLTIKGQNSPNRVSATTVQVWGMGTGLLLALLGGLPQL